MTLTKNKTQTKKTQSFLKTNLTLLANHKSDFTNHLFPQIFFVILEFLKIVQAKRFNNITFFLEFKLFKN